MKKLKLANEIADWLAKPALNKRSHAQREGDVLRYYHPCGHTSWEPWTQAVAMFLPARWAWNQNGVSCSCPRCYRVKRKEYKAQNRPMLPVKNLTRVGPDWERE